MLANILVELEDVGLGATLGSGLRVSVVGGGGGGTSLAAGLDLSHICPKDVGKGSNKDLEWETPNYRHCTGFKGSPSQRSW